MSVLCARLEALTIRCSQLPYKKVANKLSEAEFDKMVAFLEDNDHLGHLEFEYAVNRMFLDKDKSKNWSIIQELLCVCNTAVHGKKGNIL
jgi:hypothetical protein